MSTILDALRRLQRDREGEAGDPDAAQPRPGRYGRGAPRALFILVVLLIGGVAGAWFFFSGEDPTESAQQASAGEPAPGRPLARRSQPPGTGVEAVESVRERKAPLPPDDEDVRNPVEPPRPPITPAAEKVLRKRAAARGIPYKEMVRQYNEIKPRPPPPLPDRTAISPEEAMTEQDLEEVERMFSEMDANFAASGEPTSEALVPKRTLPIRERYNRVEVDPSLPAPSEQADGRTGKGTATVRVVSEPPVRSAVTSESAPAPRVEREPAPPPPSPLPSPAVREPAPPVSVPAPAVREPEPPKSTAPPKVARAEPRADEPPPLKAPTPPKATAKPKRSVTEEPAPSGFPSVVVQSVRWHPDPERRVVWLELDQTGPLELQEGDIAGGVMIRRIDPSGVEVQVGEVRKQVSVGR